MITTCPQCGEPMVYAGPMENETFQIPLLFFFDASYCYHCEQRWNEDLVDELRQQQAWWDEQSVEAAIEAGQMELPL